MAIAEPRQTHVWPWQRQRDSAGSNVSGSQKQTINRLAVLKVDVWQLPPAKHTLSPHWTPSSCHQTVTGSIQCSFQASHQYKHVSQHQTLHIAKLRPNWVADDCTWFHLFSFRQCNTILPAFVKHSWTQSGCQLMWPELACCPKELLQHQRSRCCSMQNTEMTFAKTLAQFPINVYLITIVLPFLWAWLILIHFVILYLCINKKKA